MSIKLKSTNHASTGLPLAVTAFCLWGTFPLYFKLLTTVPPMVVLAHRIAWSAVLLSVILVVRGELVSALIIMRTRGFWLSGALIATNWWIYIWAVQQGQVLDASLGYFVCPLMTVTVGVLLFREQLRPGQWFGVALVSLAVLFMVLRLGRIPWVALSLSMTFAAYATIHKKIPAAKTAALWTETTILFPLAAAVMLTHPASVSTDTPVQWYTWVLLCAAGPITVAPLMLYTRATGTVPLSQLGLIQYITPTTQFFLAVFLFGERFSSDHLIAFTFIWIGLIVFSTDGLIRRWRTQYP